MEKFAKLFETPTTQVLIFLSQDDETGFPKLFRWLYVGEMEIGAHLMWHDDEDKSYNEAEKLFEAIDQNHADKLVAETTKFVNKAVVEQLE